MLDLFNDTTHISLRWIYRSAKIVCTKNAFGYIVPPHTTGVGTTRLYKLCVEWCGMRLIEARMQKQNKENIGDLALIF